MAAHTLYYCANPGCNALGGAGPDGGPRTCAECGGIYFFTVNHPPAGWSRYDRALLLVYGISRRLRPDA